MLRRYGKHLAIACTILGCLGFIFFYQDIAQKRVRNALQEHAAILSQAIWNLDNIAVEQYFSVVEGSSQFHTLEVVEPNGEVLYSRKMGEANSLTQTLAAFGIVSLSKIEQPVLFQGQVIATIVAVWRNTTIYYFTYAVLFTLLIIAVIILYANNLESRRSLEEKMEIVEEQITELQNQKELIENIFAIVPEGLITLDQQGQEVTSNFAFKTILDEWEKATGYEAESVKTIFLKYLIEELSGSLSGQFVFSLGGLRFTLEYASSEMGYQGAVNTVVSVRDVTKISEMERELNQARKLESVGRLASGIAHEINTPTQYVFSNVTFLQDGFSDITSVMQAIEAGMGDDGGDASIRLEKILEAFDEADWGYLAEEIPQALEQSVVGLKRVSNIVGAMKSFSHPSGNTPKPADLNHAIESTVTVARNEWKYVADVSLQLDPELPLVPCLIDEFNQVILGMIVNSAHAIEKKFGETGDKKGQIVISTSKSGSDALIVVRDDGAGMVRGVREQVFDPFFTTKELNKGTGQGLAIAHDVITKKHGGGIEVESEEGVGTTFTITLPLTIDD